MFKTGDRVIILGYPEIIEAHFLKVAECSNKIAVVEYRESKEEENYFDNVGFFNLSIISPYKPEPNLKKFWLWKTIDAGGAIYSGHIYLDEGNKDPAGRGWNDELLSKIPGSEITVNMDTGEIVEEEDNK